MLNSSLRANGCVRNYVVVYTCAIHLVPSIVERDISSHIDQLWLPRSRVSILLVISNIMIQVKLRK